MYTFLFLTLLFSPIFNAEPIPTGIADNKENLLMRRSVASSYLFNLPNRRYQQRLYDASVFPSSSDSDDLSDQQNQRHKRIYWENLAFHAADYNQKPKKV